DLNLDSGCSTSMMPTTDHMTCLCSDNTTVHLADNSKIKASHRGRAHLPIDGGKEIDALVVPNLYEPLLSVASLCDENLTLVFLKSSCNIYRTPDFDTSAEPIGWGYRKGNLYYLLSNEI
ncbi:hypothetical protein CROQUDRAFT_20534, partial [Cronartium quercuum f. sp. fusiforme G11]